MEGCKQNGLAWVLNPWDDIFNEFDILQCGWTFIEQKINGDPVFAAAVMDAEKLAAGVSRSTDSLVHSLHLKDTLTVMYARFVRSDVGCERRL